MATTVDELTFNYTNEEGQQVRRELSKEVLSKGAWATLMFLYQDLDRRNNVYRPPKVSIVRYKKANGIYRKQSSFNISSEKQARAMMEVLERWYASEYMKKGGEPAAQPETARPAEDKPAEDKPAAEPAPSEAPAP